MCVAVCGKGSYYDNRTKWASFTQTHTVIIIHARMIECNTQFTVLPPYTLI